MGAKAEKDVSSFFMAHESVDQKSGPRRPLKWPRQKWAKWPDRQEEREKGITISFTGYNEGRMKE